MGLRDFGANEIAKRNLEFIWLLDCSSSMTGEKIKSLNYAIKETLPEMRRVADENPEAEVYMRVITFDSSARIHIDRTKLDDFVWDDIIADGMTAMGAAFGLLETALDVSNMSERGLRPVVVLVSDGGPNDSWESKLTKLHTMPWMIKAIRIAIAIGDDCDEQMLAKFVNNNEMGVLKAKTASDLVNYIKWASTAVLSSASAVKSTTDGQEAALPDIDTNASVSLPNNIDPDTPF